MAFNEFDIFFRNYYQDRWDSLFNGLKVASTKVMRLSFKQIHHSMVPSILEAYPLLDSCYIFANKGEYYFSPEQLKLFYVMDPASILVASALTIIPGMKVLDMCSAPGGKGLILTEKVSAGGEIILNEFSKDRRERLTQVVRDYVPTSVRPFVFVKGKDASLYGLSHQNSFDAILLDAPCSGEQHLVQNPNELEKWSVKRTKRLAQQQYSMLCSALLAARDGAEIVYSTCSISPLENDGVIEKFVEKKGDNFEIVDLDFSSTGAEKTKYGNIFLPDRCQLGPMYVVKMRVKK